MAAGVSGAQIIVVAPYNAQVNLLRERLAGTTFAWAPSTSSRVRRPRSSSTRWRASSGAEVPRGLEFLLSLQPPERGDLARTMPRLPRLQPTPARGQLPHNRPDAPRQRALSAGGACRALTPGGWAPICPTLHPHNTQCQGVPASAIRELSTRHLFA